MKIISRLSLLCVLMVMACRPAPVPEPTPAEIVHNTAVHLQSVSGFRFAISQTGTPAYLDPSETVALIRADGDYAAPDKSQATVLVRLSGFVTKVDVISIADNQWQTNPLTNKWEELPPNWGFNPAVLFDAEIGLQAILAADLSEIVLKGTEKLEDGPDDALYVVTAVVNGERLYEMSGGLIGPEAAEIQLWIMPETFELVQITLTEPGVDEESTSVWQVNFANYDQAAAIEPPVE